MTLPVITKTNPTNTAASLQLLLSVVLVMVLITLASCASPVPAPTEKLQAAELAITNAEQNRVADYSYPDLNHARETLALARTAVTDMNMVLAGRLADESRTSAELATARAEEIKAKAVNDDMQKGLNTLKQELQRNTGTRP